MREQLAHFARDGFGIGIAVPDESRHDTNGRHAEERPPPSPVEYDPDNQRRRSSRSDAHAPRMMPVAMPLSGMGIQLATSRFAAGNITASPAPRRNRTAIIIGTAMLNVAGAK